jgi:hypothetical protein
VITDKEIKQIRKQLNLILNGDPYEPADEDTIYMWKVELKGMLLNANLKDALALVNIL